MVPVGMVRILLLCFVLSACGGQVEKVRILDQEQRPSGVVERRNGIKDGPVKLFWPDGTVRTEGQYRNDRREEWWRSYHADGKNRSLTHYSNGLKDGLCIYWDSLERPMRADYFVRGVANGPFYRYFPDGRLAQRSNYVDGLLEGPHSQWYDERGGSYISGYFHAGEELGLWTERDTTGHLIWQAYMKNGEVTRAYYGERRWH